ncbi:MAG: NAD(P)H-dependent oxidoreductase [Corynebacterium sp.]|nr:NAD(P)H-dependent oxidoreductase [Corynebacterium sp.]
MRTLVLLFHPHLDSSTANRILAEEMATRGVEVRNMYALYPDLRIDVPLEQSLLDQADRIILQFPTYWYAGPALMKQWIDSVLTPGWAYEGGWHLRGKIFQILTTSGGDLSDAPHFLAPLEATINYVQGQWQQPISISNTAYTNKEELAAQLRGCVDKLF